MEKKFEAYQKVRNDGQKAISTHWVITKKEDTVKARLCTRGYEDNFIEKNDSHVRKVA